MNQLPVLSICCITYNHAAFIADCVNGFLLQQTNFPIEILIFDDASTDGTQDILKSFAAKDNRIRLFLQKENQWVKKKYGLLEWLFPESKGKYIALCEGDDYWIDPLKLQKQVDFLEANSGASLCFHRFYKLNNNQLYPVSIVKPIGEQYTFIDIVETYIFQTATIVFRNNINFPPIFKDLPLGDVPLFFLCGQKGYYGFIDEFMSVYRITENGVWTNNQQNQAAKQWKLYHVYKTIYGWANPKEKGYLKKALRKRLSYVAVNQFPKSKWKQLFYKMFLYGRFHLQYGVVK